VLPIHSRNLHGIQEAPIFKDLKKSIKP